MPIDDKAIADLRARYLPVAFIRRYELLLPLEAALHLLDDLEKLGVIVTGCDLWRYVDIQRTGVISLLGAGTGVSDEEYADVTAEEGAMLVRAFLLHKLPDDAELVSFLSKDEDVNAWFADSPAESTI